MSAWSATGPRVSIELLLPSTTCVNWYSWSLMRTSGTWPACTQVTNSLKLTCCFLSPGCNTCQIARNITMSRTHSSRVLCDCFTSTSSCLGSHGAAVLADRPVGLQQLLSYDA